MCGDPDCERCFPREPGEPDPDEYYEITRQREIDEPPASKEEPDHA
jgi:hypothetical protein